MRRIVLAVPLAVLAVAASAGAVLYWPGEEPTIGSIRMSYGANDAIRDTLLQSGIEMSSAVTLSGAQAAQFCSFFEGGGAPPYCTSTELTADGRFLGNVHMVGTSERPQAALGVVQTDAIWSTDAVAAVAGAMIVHLACDCPDKTAVQWIGDVSERHHRGAATTTKSTIDGLPAPVLLEVTSSQDHYLWKILVGAPP